MFRVVDFGIVTVEHVLTAFTKAGASSLPEAFKVQLSCAKVKAAIARATRGMKDFISRD
jgi:hypothetical protein